MKRRDFLKKTAALGIGSALLPATGFPESSRDQGAAKGPVVIVSGNGEVAARHALTQLQQGGEVLDAIIGGVTLVEDNPEDITVGYGGLPNEDGVVQLDAAVMHGPTHNAGGVAAIEGIRNPAKVARLVMERSDHVLLVGEGAKRFAKAHGFPEENLLTDKTRKIWLKWKETLSDQDKWFPGPDDEYSELLREYRHNYGTIHCSALDANGDLAAVTTTSGLSFKIPGRVGDSPIIGAGLYVDNAVGAAGSTGRGEANLTNLSCFMIVEFMRMGKSPQEACLEVCRRIVDHNRLPHLRHKDGKPNFGVNFYAVNRAGETGGAGIYRPSRGYWVGDANGVRELEMGYLYERREE